jgi:2-amino-4-hydroxy-6-hydroxymethyldihydropteridine diphosphokinase
VNTAWISAGSNIGDRRAQLGRAIAALEACGRVIAVSSCYETEPVGYDDQPWFLNLAAGLETRLTPHQLLSFCQSIELAQGRMRPFPNAPRTLDLDILFYGDLILDRPDLVLPHPRLEDRRFVLEPLAEIAPLLRHPVLKRSVRQLLELCPDRSVVRKVESGG